MATRSAESMKHLRKLGYTGVAAVEKYVTFEHGGGFDAELAEALRRLTTDAVWFRPSEPGGNKSQCRWCNAAKGKAHHGYCMIGKALILLAKLPTPKPATGQRAKYAGGYRKDLWGFADIIAFRRLVPGIIAVQCTTAASVTGHVLKYRRDEEIRANILACLAAGNRFLIHGWKKTTVANKSNTGTHARWELTVREITAVDMELTDADRRILEVAKAAGAKL